MKQKGTHENAPPGIRHTETTQDERIRVISLHDDAGLSWTAIGQRLGINRGTAQKVNDFNTLAGIATINTALERSTKGQRKMVPHRIACELAALQFSTMPRNSDWLTCHARCANKALDLGSDMPRNGLRLLYAHCKEFDGLHGIS